MGNSVEISLKLSALTDLIVLGIVQSVGVYWVYREWIPRKSFLNDNEGEIPRKIEYLFVIGIILSTLGHAIHVLGNLLEHPARGEASLELHGLIYFYDEFIGHGVIVVGLFFYIAAIWKLESLLPGRASNLLEKILLILLGLGFGIGSALAILEGQSVPVTLVLGGILGILVLTNLRKEGMKAPNREISTFILLFILAQVLTIIVWAAITGIRPEYAFFVQPSELK